MIMNAVLAVALGLTPVQPGKPVQVFQYKPQDYAGLIGRYHQRVDARGVIHLRGFDRLTAKPFDLAVAKDGKVEGTVGEMYLTFTVREQA